MYLILLPNYLTSVREKGGVSPNVRVAGSQQDFFPLICSGSFNETFQNHPTDLEVSH